MGLWESLVSSFQWRGQPQLIIDPTSSVAPELLPESYGADCRPNARSSSSSLHQRSRVRGLLCLCTVAWSVLQQHDAVRPVTKADSFNFFF